MEEGFNGRVKKVDKVDRVDIGVLPRRVSRKDKVESDRAYAGTRR